MPPETGEFFHDIRDIPKSLDKILKGADIPNHYEPRKYVLTNYGNANSGKRLLNFGIVGNQWVRVWGEPIGAAYVAPPLVAEAELEPLKATLS